MRLSDLKKQIYIYIYIYMNDIMDLFYISVSAILLMSSYTCCIYP